MAGLYLVGFAAPNLEAATCYVGETIDPARNVPRAMLTTCALAGFYSSACRSCGSAFSGRKR